MRSTAWVTFHELSVPGGDKRETAPEIRTGYIMTMSYGSISQVTAADFFSVRYDYVTEGFVREAHALGKEVHGLDGKLQGKYKADAGYGSR